MKVCSFFSGAGGLDLGFKNAGYEVIYANEFDKNVWTTYTTNHPETTLDKRSITDIPSAEVPECDIIIGGPPCQSWSEAGSKRGINDERGKLFYEFIRILKDNQPKAFVAENVPGILAPRHKQALAGIIESFDSAGFDITLHKVNANKHGSPQDRQRVFFIGTRKNLNIEFTLEKQDNPLVTLRESIFDLQDSAKAAPKNRCNHNLDIPNHEYAIGGFSSMYMSRNRVRDWDETSFTIQASARHAPIHPSHPKMIKIKPNLFRFNAITTPRRLSVRECARIQGFPDSFIFHYTNVDHGYKMIGNAVPVPLGEYIARSLHKELFL